MHKPLAMPDLRLGFQLLSSLLQVHAAERVRLHGRDPGQPDGSPVSSHGSVSDPATVDKGDPGQPYRGGKEHLHSRILSG